MKKLLIIFLLYAINLYATNAYPATLWVNPAGSATSPYETKAKGLTTIAAGVAAMSGGDTLYITDGTYTDEPISEPPSGTAEAYTFIYAENDWGVILNDMSSGSHMYLDSTNYLHVQGFKMHGTGNDCQVNGDYVKIIRCSSDGKPGIQDPGFAFQAAGNYILFEECYAYGGGRYPMRTSSSTGQYIIFRRCVVRFDFYSDNGPATQEPYAAFANYDKPNVYFQNCIAIDGLDIRANDSTYDGLKAFFTPNGANQTSFIGCIALNHEGGFYMEDSPVTNILLSNCISWDIKNNRYPAGYSDGYPKNNVYARPGDGPVTVDNCTIGVGTVFGYNARADLATDNLTDSIIYNITNSGNAVDAGLTTEDYNCYYGNDGNYSGTEGANDLCSENENAIDPLTNGLLYLTRIEAGSTLKTAGSDSGQIGAEIMYQHGTAGTLYDEAGWNTLTAVALWPFPNEAEMRTDMKAVSHAAESLWDDADANIDSDNPVISGDRGFCVDGKTLTGYIWEYLGNTIPAEIYGGGTDTDAPADVSDLSAASGASVGTIDLSWTAPGDDSVTGTATTYDVRYSTSTINSGTWATDTEATGEPSPSIASTAETMTVSGLTKGITYYFAIKTSDEVPNESGLSNVANAVATISPPKTVGITLSGATIR